jgi:hypothetical protein
MLNYLYVAMALALAIYVATLPEETEDAAQSPPAAESVEGQGPETLGCVACVGGGILLALQGWGTLLVAAFTEGSALAVAGCVGMCWAAIT